MIFSLKKMRNCHWKVCLLVVEYFDSLVPYVKTENDVKLCLSTWMKGVDIKNPIFVLSGLFTPF